MKLITKKNSDKCIIYQIELPNRDKQRNTIVFFILWVLNYCLGRKKGSKEKKGDFQGSKEMFGGFTEVFEMKLDS